MGLISEEFHQVSAREECRLVAKLADQQQAVLEAIQRLEEQSELSPCGCPARVSAPSPPVLPFPATESNRQRLKEFLLSYYKSSTFNVCPHQPLPLMHGPPLEFKLKPDAKPFAVYSPATVPAHWANQVKADIQRDVQLGVLEKVEPEMDSGVDDWCSRMVIGRKHREEPRRTSDLQPLNDASVSQCHPTAPPLTGYWRWPRGWS